jgi:hypothetical protein
MVDELTSNRCDMIGCYALQFFVATVGKHRQHHSTIVCRRLARNKAITNETIKPPS